MARGSDTDFANTLSMLHTAVMHTGNELRDALGKSVEKLEASGQAAQQDTTRAVVDELGRMRVNLREARDRLAAGGESLNEEVRQAVTQLRTELRQVRAAVEDLTPPTQASLPASSIPGPTDPYEPAVREAPRSETSESLSTPPHPAPAAITAEHRAAAPAVHATIPVQRDGSDRGTADDVPLPVESPQQVIRDILIEELAPLRSLLEGKAHGQDEALSTFRDDVRAQLRGVAEELREHLTAAQEESRAEFAALREEATGLRDELEKLRLAADAGKPAAVEVTEEHSELLRQAARVSSVALLCHRDVWEFITAHAGRHPHFRVPPQVTDKGHERVRAALSGRSLIALLISLHSVEHTASDGDGNRELAATLYERIHASLAGLTATGQPVTITLDDRAFSTDDTATDSATPDTAAISSPGLDDASRLDDQHGNEQEHGPTGDKNA